MRPSRKQAESALPAWHSDIFFTGGKSNYKIKKVVLDAGHGGKDPGCKGVASSQEKHHALAIALRLGAYLTLNFPDVEVIYTRKTDEFIELNERAAIANRNNADLFISIHCNSISVSHVHGAETYVMGLHTAQHNLEVAKRENASIFLEDNYQKNYGGYDPNSPEAHIFSAVWQSAYLEQSILFASFVQQNARTIAGREDKGVKQAGFLVLRETAMPSVLIETGYLTHRAEEEFIASEEGQDKMAHAIAEAFRLYSAQMEGGGPRVALKKPPAVPKKDPVADKAAKPFRILLLAWPNRMDTNSGLLSLLRDVEEEFVDGKYNYYLGRFKTREEAEKKLPELQNLGFRTAKIVETPQQ